MKVFLEPESQIDYEQLPLNELPQVQDMQLLKFLQETNTQKLILYKWFES